MTTIPETIGRYRIVERVGAGGMGVLYRGIDPVLDRDVAIKVMLTELAVDADQMRERFSREARAIAKLQHRNIVTVFEFAEQNGTPYIVMEFLQGVSLAARLATPPRLTLDQKLDIVTQLCAGLGFAHVRGIVHRDVKPANVFLLSDGSVKLLDFGLARIVDSNLTRLGDTLGSIHYMSPEQVVASDRIDARADVFSTGTMLYEMLAGRKPFDASSPTAVLMKIVDDDPPPIQSLVPGIPESLIAIVNRALAKNPTQRFSSAVELERELRSVRADAGQPPTIVARPAELEPVQDATLPTVNLPALIAADATLVTDLPTVSPSAPPPVAAPAAAVSPASMPSAPTAAPASAPADAVSASARPRRNLWLVAAAIAALVLAGAAFALFSNWGRSTVTSSSPPVPAPATASSRSASTPSSTTTSIPAATTMTEPPAAPPAAPTVAEPIPAVVPETVVRPSPPLRRGPARAAPAPPPEVVARCGRLLERLSLGENLTLAESKFLNENCKK